MSEHQPTGRAILQASDVHVFAGSRTLLSAVDIEVRAGECLGVVGESGSGKSMLMKAVLGLLPAGTSSTGEVWFDGTRIDGWDERQMRAIRGRRLSLLLQDPFTMLNPLQSIGVTIAESLRSDQRLSRAARRAEVERRLTEVGIDPAVASKRPFQLSGGMRQRVAIAAALAADPDVLVADEPTTALDVRTQHEILELLTALRRDRGMALVLITHDLRVAFDMCDRVTVMYAGGVIEEAPAAALEGGALHPYSLGLMLAEPPVAHYAATLNAIPGSVPDHDDVKNRCSFAERCAWSTSSCTDSRPALREVAERRRTSCGRIETIADELVSARATATRSESRPAVDAGPALLTVTDIRKTFHTARLAGASVANVALDGVSFSLAEGESLGLVGESGSGKTTIARAVLGLSTPDSGTIQLAGHDISRFRHLSRRDLRDVRRLVQVVFQDPYASLNPALTIGAALREAVDMRGDAADPDAEVKEALARVSLPASYAAKYPSGLSGGERQRVSIARALCMKPRLLICDEPVAALDVSVQAQILELLREIHRDVGMAMLFITHDLAVVRQVTERVIVLSRGVVVEAGRTDDVLDDPQDAYTRSLVDAVPGRASHAPAEPDRVSAVGTDV